MDASKVMQLTSAYTFDETLQRIRAAIEQAGMRLFAEIDHAAAASSVGLTMPPTMVLVYGNPLGGTPLMLAAPAIALDLPLRVLVREAGGQVVVAFHTALSLTRSGGLSDDKAVNLQRAETVITGAII